MKHRNLTGDLAIDAACVEFEKALRGNESPSIEAIVGANPNIDHHRLIEQLVLLEVEFLAENVNGGRKAWRLAGASSAD